jgi:hypothetical protein
LFVDEERRGWKAGSGRNVWRGRITESWSLGYGGIWSKAFRKRWRETKGRGRESGVWDEGAWGQD